MTKITCTFLLSIFLSLPVAAQIQRIEIDPSKKHQTIDNFAAADAWSGNFVGKYWEESEKQQIAEWLFSTEFDHTGKPKGIGLSLWRVNVGAGTFEQADADILPLQRRAESFLTTDGKYYDWGKASGQQYFMQKAADLGCNNFLIFSNSPPVQYTLNGKGWSSLDNAANLEPEHYDTFAEYLTQVTLYYTRKGWNISYISPINEPQVKWDTPRQEGTPWKKSEMRNVFVSLDRALSRQSKLSHVKMLLGESANLKVLYTQEEPLRKRFGGEEAPDEQVKTFFDPNSPYYLGNLKHLPRLIAGHSYGNHRTNAEMREVRFNTGKIAESYKVEFQQSEWCLLPNYLHPMDGFTADWQPGNRGDIQVALLMGRLIHSDFVDGNSTAWGYWKGMELNGDHALIALHAKDNNIFNGGTVSANKILWGLGNFSLFVRPGYVRIGTHGADDLNSLAGTSYLSPDKSKIVTVLVNSAFDNKAIELVLPPPYRNAISTISMYRTNENSNLTKTPVAKSDFKYTAEARTLTTIVFDLEKTDVTK